MFIDFYSNYYLVYNHKTLIKILCWNENNIVIKMPIFEEQFPLEFVNKCFYFPRNNLFKIFWFCVKFDSDTIKQKYILLKLYS